MAGRERRMIISGEFSQQYIDRRSLPACNANLLQLFRDSKDNFTWFPLQQGISKAPSLFIRVRNRG